jgi:acyl carrier protein
VSYSNIRRLESIETAIKKIIADIISYDINQINSDTKLRSDPRETSDEMENVLEISSLELAELLINIDEKFNVNIPDEEANKIDTIQALAKYVIDHSNDSDDDPDSAYESDASSNESVNVSD